MPTGNGLRRWESFGIIQESYIKSLMVSREAAGTVNGQAGILRQWVAEIPPVGALFALRYGKICDNAHLISISPQETASNGHGD
jgi:hypothetical protein